MNKDAGDWKDWVEHVGTEDDVEPVHPYTTVEVVLRDGDNLYGAADSFRWSASSPDSLHAYRLDIVRYRVITPFQEPAKESTTPPKDTMKIYCDNFLALTKALENAGGNAVGILMRSHEFLETLARNRIEIDAKYLREGV